THTLHTLPLPSPLSPRVLQVPFGEVGAVRDWLGVSGEVGRPVREHPKRPVLGWSCRRSEVSGRRFWGLFRSIFGEGGAPEFFSRCFVHNLCPLVFLDASGRNLTPSDLPPPVRRFLLPICERSLGQTLRLLGVQTVVGVGRLAEAAARRAVSGGEGEGGVRVERIDHPSPRNPRANRGWAERAEASLREIGLGRERED
ncbi:single-strand selective monofunctional uracil DNA glycosylase, partial [Amblyraja radiata]|uniref:single-strand selective monofunctional uracil DNA glycosylase n=1 Tax=Amblyraja radiata TaxID=386614 RepID=UPI0014022BF8